MTKALAKEFGGRGICVNAVCPGKYGHIEEEVTSKKHLIQFNRKTEWNIGL